MRLEVDQSRKIEQGGPTILAFSDHEHGTLLVPNQVKRQVLRRLREQGRERRASVHMVFAALVALLLRDVVKHADLVIIDDEYTGYRGMIKFQVLHYLRKLGIEVEGETITFGLVGRHSPAHDLAISVFRGQRGPDRWVTFEELWALVGLKRAGACCAVTCSSSHGVNTVRALHHPASDNSIPVSRQIVKNCKTSLSW